MRKNKPRIHITVNVVRALRQSPPNKKEFTWDDEVRGFGAYRNSGGVIVFVYQYRLPHQPARRAKIGEFGDLTPTQARDIARDLAVQRRQGRDPVEERRAAAREQAAAQNLVMSAYVEAYIRRRNLEERPLTPQHERILVNDVAGLMPNVRIDRMTTGDIDAWLEALQQRSKSARIYGLVYLKVILNDAKARGAIPTSPADSYKIPARTERDRVLSIHELMRLMEALHDMADRHADVIECLLRTMRRKEEVAAMSWEEIEQETWTWTVPGERTKTGERIVMDLPPQVVTILERQQPDVAKRTGWVFSHTGEHSVSTSTQAKDALDAHIHRRMELAVASGQPQRRMEQWNFHDFRTTGSTHAGEAPLNIRDDVLELCIGHKLSRSKYSRSEKRQLTRQAYLDWNGFLDDLMRREDAWPGGRTLDRVPKGEMKRRKLALREGWRRKVRPIRKGQRSGGRAPR